MERAYAETIPDKINQMISISALYIYPIKSLGGLAIKTGKLTDRGLEHDRRFMLIDWENKFITQRECSKMALLQTNIENETLIVSEKYNSNNKISFSLSPVGNKIITVRIWDDVCEAMLLPDAISFWFSTVLEIDCRLVYMNETSIRLADTKYVKLENRISLSDAYPLTIISESSLNDLNRKLNDNLLMNRFRPNIVIKGSNAHQEDTFKKIIINGLTFYGVKLLARCPIITIDQHTSLRGKEPLQILSKYRKKNNKVFFGNNFIYETLGNISVGDEIIIQETIPYLF